MLVVGIDPGNEPRVSTLDQLIREGSFLSKGDSGKALAGKLLARYLKTDIGDELTLLGQGKDGSIAATLVTVRGIYSSGMDDFDRSALQIPLKDFQDLFTMGGDVHRIVLTLDGLNFVNTVKTQIQKAFEKNGLSKALVVLDWKELMPGLVQGIKIDLASGIIFYMILVIIVAFSILNTFLMALFERTREFGILLAMGASPGRLFKVLFMESILLTLAGTLIGICIGSGITLYFQTRGIMIAGASEMLSQYGITGLIHPKLTLISMVTGPGLVILITLFAALYPAVKVKKLKPLDALTQRGY